MSVGARMLLDTMAGTASDQVNRNQVQVLTGTVTSMSPLTIAVQGSLTLTEEMLTLHPVCRPKIITTAAHNHPTAGGVALETLQLWRGLQTGDAVRIISYDGKQGYYVLERITAWEDE